MRWRITAILPCPYKPVSAGEARPEEYSPTFGEAGERLKVAVEFLHAQGYKKIAIVSHSMGSRMTHNYLTRDPSAPVNAWAALVWGVKMILGT